MRHQPTPSGYLHDPFESSIADQIAEQQEALAVNGALGSIHISEWRAYIKSYSEGRFNVIAPPHPPPQAAGFRYLPAMFPAEEENRRRVSEQYDILWPRWDEEKAGALILAAMKKFDTRYAAISFFDGQSETFKAENGYGRMEIPREISIAAHALFSEDTLVVLDTKQDWRFAENPLVIGKPNIRFFAAAPMLAPGGEVVGVFSLFSKVPRTSFTHFQRRELAEFSQLAMTDLKLQAEWLSDPDVRSTPILQRTSLINADTRPSRTYTPTSERNSIHESPEMNVSPPRLRYHKVISPTTRDSQIYMSADEFAAGLEPTPPSSSGSWANHFQDLPCRFGKNHKQLSVGPNGNSTNGFYDIVPPDSGAFIELSPRPFSSSDLTSLNNHPPNTPNASLWNGCEQAIPKFELTVEDFLSLTDLDCAEPTEADRSATGAHQPWSSEGDVDSSTKSPISSTRHGSISTDGSSHSSLTRSSREVRKSLAEAAFSCSFTAQSLGYDLVYAAEVKPNSPYLTDEELSHPGMTEVKILVAYGLNKKTQLNADLHLQALRSQGYHTIGHNPGHIYQDDEFERGYLIPLTEDEGPREKCRSGVVFCAYRRPRTQEFSPPHQSVEVKKLIGAGKALHRILKRAAERQGPNRPLPVPLRAFPAHEAVEV